ncbi:MAG: DUF4065 domain-containing protein [Clostridiales bacterium]|nr:DUF4065 domain-containing protein [Clostridiales bacterium]
MENIKKNNYVLKCERVKYVIKDEEIEVDEKYYVNPENNERVYNRDLSIENDIVAYDAYKRKKELLTTEEIKEIRKKYDLTQKEYALAIGVGEITVHRFENGTIQTESIDSIMRLSAMPKNMKELITKNKDKLSVELLNKTLNIIEKLIKNEEHKIAIINYNELKKLKYEISDVNTVADNIIVEFNKKIEEKEKQLKTEFSKITPLELQKHLYYVTGICMAVFNKPAFANNIVAWEHGPVVEEIYQKYKAHGKKEIQTPKVYGDVSEGIKRIIKEVVEGYSKYNGGQLIDLTHDEMPWETTKHNQVIDNEKIKQYFKEVYAC